MDPQNLILFVKSSRFYAGTSLICAAVVAETADYPREVTINWREDPHDRDGRLILAEPGEVTIPAGEKCVVFELNTDRTNFGSVELAATLEEENAADFQKIEIQAVRRPFDTIAILISLMPTNADTGAGIPPFRGGHSTIAWPIGTHIRITMSGDWGIANVLVKKPDVSHAVFQLNPQTGQEMQLRNRHITFIKDPEDIPSREDSGDFVFKLDPQNLDPGRYIVRLNVTLHARTTNNDYTGSKSIDVYFDNP